MAKVNHNITQNQYIHILLSSMIGIGILTIGNGMKAAKQSAWIPVLLLGIYPIFTVFCSSYIDKKSGHMQYWEMSIKVYGKILTYMFTFIFLIDFLLTLVFTLSGFTNLLSFALTTYLPAKLTLVLLTLFSVFIALDGLTYIGRLCELLFFSMLILLLAPLTFYRGGNIINVEPFIGSFNGILSVIPSCIYPYIGIEITFLITPLIVNSTSVKKSGIYACLFTIVFYTFVAFAVIYYAGWELTSKLRYPLLFLLRSIPIPLLTDTQSIFVFLWSSVIFKIASIMTFGVSYCSTKIFHIQYKKAVMLLIPALYFISSFLLIETKRRVVIGIVAPYMIGFVVLWSILTIIIVHFKLRGDKFEKN